MTESLARLLPIAVLGAIAPLPLALVVSLLMSARGLVKATAFVLAEGLVYAGLCLLVISLGSFTAGAAALDAVAAGALLAGVGVALWAAALWQLLRVSNPDSGTIPYFAKLDQMTVMTTAVLGTIITLVNVKQLSLYLVGMSELVGSDVPPLQTWALATSFMAVFQIGQITAIGAYVVAPSALSAVLLSLRSWLTSHMRAMSIALGSLLGSWFFVLAAEQLGQ